MGLKTFIACLFLGLNGTLDAQSGWQVPEAGVSLLQSTVQVPEADVTVPESGVQGPPSHGQERPSGGQQVDSIRTSKADIQDYIRTFPEKITLRAGLVNTGNSFTIRDPESDIRLRLQPGISNYLGFSALFRSVELDFGFSPGFLNREDSQADPKLFNLNFRMFLGQWMQTLDFYKQSGFYYDLNGFRDYLPGLKTLKIGGSTSYIFNPRFSFRAIGFQNEWQKKSAGSFIPGVQLYHTHFHLRDAGEERIENAWDLTAGPGYYYNLILGGHFLLGVGNTTGVGIRYVSTEGTRYGTFALESRFRMAAGYNSERFFAGVNFSYDLLHQYEREGVRLDDSVHFLEFYVGYRLDAPAGWIRAADRFNRKFGME